VAEERGVTKLACMARFTACRFLLASDGEGLARLEVTVTRIGPRLFDNDNNVGSAKATRDGIADALGVNDNDPRVTWKNEQRKNAKYAVEIEIWEIGGPAIK
jgi:hypothetical protein